LEAKHPYGSMKLMTGGSERSGKCQVIKKVKGWGELNFIILFRLSLVSEEVMRFREGIVGRE
jgi:hypothetical protein